MFWNDARYHFRGGGEKISKFDRTINFCRTEEFTIHTERKTSGFQREYDEIKSKRFAKLLSYLINKYKKNVHLRNRCESCDQNTLQKSSNKIKIKRTFRAGTKLSSGK